MIIVEGSLGRECIDVESTIHEHFVKSRQRKPQNRSHSSDKNNLMVIATSYAANQRPAWIIQTQQEGGSLFHLEGGIDGYIQRVGQTIVWEAARLFKPVGIYVHNGPFESSVEIDAVRLDLLTLPADVSRHYRLGEAVMQLEGMLTPPVSSERRN